MAELSRQEKWTVKGHIDATCGRCQHVGVDVLIEVVIDARMRSVDSDFELGLHVPDGEVPIMLQCPACRNTVNYGKAMELTVAQC